MILVDYVGNRVYEEIEKKFKNYLDKNKLQKILFQCIKKAQVDVNPDVEEMIMGIESDMIKPNLSNDTIKENLKEIFGSIVESEAKADYIIREYKQESYKEVLELYHIQESLDEICKGVNKQAETLGKIDGNVNRQAERLEKIDEGMEKVPEKVRLELRKQLKGELFFVNELDYSKSYFYFEVELSEVFEDIQSVLESIFEQLREELSICFMDKYNYDDDGILDNVRIEFWEPILQYRFREFLSQMDQLFLDEDIKIFRVSTHY